MYFWFQLRPEERWGMSLAPTWGAREGGGTSERSSITELTAGQGPWDAWEGEIPGAKNAFPLN